MIGEKIRKLRKQHGMTQTELAKKLHVEQPHLNRWENGARNPSLETLKKISKIFDISIDTLAFDQKDLKDLNIKNKNVIEKIKQIEKLSDSDKEMIFNLINSLAEKQKI